MAVGHKPIGHIPACVVDAARNGGPCVLLLGVGLVEMQAEQVDVGCEVDSDFIRVSLKDGRTCLVRGQHVCGVIFPKGVK